MTKTARIYFCMILTASAFVPHTSAAQTAADIRAAQRQAEIIQRQEQDRIQRDQEEARRQSDSVNGMDTRSLLPKIEVPRINAACHQITAIVINDAPHLSDGLKKQIADEFSGRCLNVGDIEVILTKITKYYIDRGFIAVRAYLPAQDLSKGILQILVVEGKVEKITIEDGNGGSISTGNVFPGVVGALLNLRDLEQGIEQINRLGSNNAKLDIQPGEKPGESTVLVRNQPQSRFHLYASVDNQGQESTGKIQTGITGSVDNLLGFNDFISMTHRESTPGDQSRKYSGSDSLNFNIPFGYSTLSLGSSRSKYASTILLPSGLSLVSSGNTTRACSQ
jgi:hemolysin activation/secretion protein